MEGNYTIDEILPIKNVRFICPHCHTESKSGNALTKHIKEVHHLKMFVCRKCAKTFSTLSDLFLHSKNVHKTDGGVRAIKSKPKEEGKLKCVVHGCHYSTNNGGTMRHHYNSHCKVKPYKCQICFKLFTQLSNCKTHEARHSTTKNFRCEICNTYYKTHDILLSHKETRKHKLKEQSQFIEYKMIPWKCLGCDERFEGLKQTKRHQCPSNSSDKFQCMDCNKIITHKSDVKPHIAEHQKERTLFCSDCNAGPFNSTLKLSHHMTRTHNNNVVRSHVCRYCENLFESKDILYQHKLDMHYAELNSRKSRGAAGTLECIYCDFTTNTVISYKSHCRKKHAKISDQILRPGINEKDIENHIEILKQNDDNYNSEQTFEEILERRPRGRPRKDQTHLNTGDNVPKLNEEMIQRLNQPPEIIENIPMKRKRGRPPKSNSSSLSKSETKEDEPELCKKRGRPKKTREIKEQPLIYSLQDLSTNDEFLIDQNSCNQITQQDVKDINQTNKIKQEQQNQYNSFEQPDQYNSFEQPDQYNSLRITSIGVKI